jgi:beta-glucosidase/6-phospho-beta-glucosidase/beta-galactosidase
LQHSSTFKSYLLGGFECSTHRRSDGHRLDLVAATAHDRHVESDYRELAHHGIRTVRDGLRWHLIETAPRRYDWSSFLPALRAARSVGTQVIWDLCHYGWPDDLDIWSPAFVDRFADFAAAVARQVREETQDAPLYCPINEISYWAWAGGDQGRINPCAFGRGTELKAQLIRASIAAIGAIRSVDARARFITAEPLINVVSPGEDPQQQRDAEAYRHYQFEALDALAHPADARHGQSSCLDIIGVNYYPENQWWLNGPTIPFGHYAYRPLSDMLIEVHRRYGRPILIAETGAEGSARPSWLHYVFSEVREAERHGVPLLGVCLYPVLDYPGWENERHCRVGLLGLPDQHGKRPVCERTATELRQRAHSEALQTC